MTAATNDDHYKMLKKILNTSYNNHVTSLELGAKVNAKEEEIKMKKDIKKYSTIKEEEEKDATEKMQEIRIITTTATLDGFLIENNEI